MEDINVLTIPFQRGQEVVIPAGATYHTTAPNTVGAQTTKRKQRIVIDHVFNAYPQRHLKAGKSVVTVIPPKVCFAGSGGYWKEVTVTEDILALNGLAPTYEEVTV